MRKIDNITVERLHPSGGLAVSGWVDGFYLVTRVYYQYTQREAIALFRATVASEGR